MKRIVLMTIICLALVVWCTPSFAGWLKNATITKVLFINGSARITAESGAVVFVKYVDSTQTNEILATALTAYSLGSKVEIYHDTFTDKITAVMLVSTP